MIPRDGLRSRLRVVRDDQRMHMELFGGRYASEQPIVVDDGLTKIKFTVENPVTEAHQVQLTVSGLAAGNYRVTVDGKTETIKIVDSKSDTRIELPIGAATAQVAIEKVE